jgi:hypothetical protein
VTESDDLRAFIRDLMARFDRGLEAVIAEQRVARQEQRVAHEESRRKLDELHRKTDEMIEEGRAGREALFRIFDKLDGGGASPAT